MKEPVFIGAGTRGAKLVGNEFQPYMDFHGKTCLEYVVEAAMQARSVGAIYVWGDKKTLDGILEEHVKQYRQLLVIVEERENIVESFFFTFLNYISRDSNTLRSMITNWESIKNINWNQLEEYFKKTDHWEKQVNVIVSDTPLISSYELDYLIENKNRDADILIGRTVRNDYKTILDILGEIPDKEKSIKNFYTYRIGNRDVPLIVNSFIAGKPLKLNKNIWNLVGNFYENRTIIAGRKKNLRKIATNLLLFKRLFFPKHFGTEQYSYAKKGRAVFYLINAYKAIIKSKRDSTNYRDLKKIYENIHTLGNLTFEYDLSHCFGSAFDIDTEYEADFIRKNFFALQNICYEYYKTHNGPQL
ncbi:MAG: hypothetical protein OEL85_03855 [Desulfobulbaceae bacterium]|nr:hypothetical protein [Desulfobulbaceae bacterium]